MTGDRDLDAWIAEHCFGAKWEPHRWASGEGELLISQSGGWLVGRMADESDMHYHELPEYSSDPSACAQVKAKLREAGVNFDIWHYNPWPERGAPWLVGVHGDVGGKRLPYWEAGSEESAICLFAKALVESGAWRP